MFRTDILIWELYSKWLSFVLISIASINAAQPMLNVGLNMNWHKMCYVCQVAVVHVCEATLTKRLIEFENTDSGSLTVCICFTWNYQMGLSVHQMTSALLDFSYFSQPFGEELSTQVSLLIGLTSYIKSCSTKYKHKNISKLDRNVTSTEKTSKARLPLNTETNRITSCSKHVLELHIT